MKAFRLLATLLFFSGVVAPLRADSFIMEAGNGKKLYKWDGRHLMAYSSGKRLFRWDGQHILLYSNGKRLYRWDGVYLMLNGNGK